MDFEENFFVIIAITVLFLIGLGICNLIVVALMKLRDRDVKRRG